MLYSRVSSIGIDIEIVDMYIYIVYITHNHYIYTTVIISTVYC